MKLTLTVAAGVFLGLLAVIGVLAGLRWNARRVQQRQAIGRPNNTSAPPLRSNAKRVQDRQVDEAVFNLELASLTPEHFITLCGKPATDSTESVLGEKLFRTLTYFQAGSRSQVVFSYAPNDVPVGPAEVSTPGAKWSLLDKGMTGDAFRAHFEAVFPCVMQPDKLYAMIRSSVAAALSGNCDKYAEMMDREFQNLGSDGVKVAGDKRKLIIIDLLWQSPSAVADDLFVRRILGDAKGLSLMRSYGCTSLEIQYFGDEDGRHRSFEQHYNLGTQGDPKIERTK